MSTGQSRPVPHFIRLAFWDLTFLNWLSKSQSPSSQTDMNSFLSNVQYTRGELSWIQWIYLLSPFQFPYLPHLSFSHTHFDPFLSSPFPYVMTKMPIFLRLRVSAIQTIVILSNLALYHQISIRFCMFIRTHVSIHKPFYFCNVMYFWVKV